MSTPVTTLQLTFDDEFNSFSNSPNGSVGWETKLPYYGSAARNLSATHEAEYYSDSSVGVNPYSVANGVLSITATIANPATNHGLPYASGAMTTYDSFAQEYGYFEINAKLPAGNGLWSAFWMAPTSLDGQSELDAFEVLGNDPKQLYATTHTLVNGVFTPYLQQLNVPDTSAAFHTYGIDWEPKTITWYEDGVAIATAPTPANMNEKMFMLLTLAVGGVGSWPGAPTSSSEFPASMQINYVHAYATANTKYVSGTAAIGLGAPEGEASVTGVVAVGLGAGTALSGVTITLLSASGVSLASTTTDVHGDYQFTYLDPGSYQVRMTTPAGYVLQAGSLGTLALTLTAGEADQVGPLKLAKSTITTGAVAGTVVLDGSGAGVSGVSVTLLNSAGATVVTTPTGTSGTFSFTGVAAGTYQVKYTAPGGDALDSGPASDSTGLTGALTVTAGQTLTLTAETLAPVAPTTGAVAGTVQLQSSGAGISGVTVSLLNASGETVATTTSSASGAFNFTDVAAGTYEVKYTAPTGDVLKSGPANDSTGLTGTLTVTAGQTLALGPETVATGPISTGTILGSVLFAGAGQAGVTVTLMNAGGGTITTAITNADGDFGFTNRIAGTYEIRYTAPAGEIFQAGDPANTVTGVTGTFALGVGQTYTAAPEHLLLASAATTSLTMTGSHPILTPGSGVFIVTGDPEAGTLVLGDGNQTVDLGGYGNTVTLGNGNDTVTFTGAAEVLNAGNGTENITLNGNFDSVTFDTTSSGTTSTVSVSGQGNTITAGAGDVTVTGSGGGDTVTFGAGDHIVSLTNSHNSITVGSGTNVIDAGANGAIVHTAGGNATVTVGGESNLVDVGAGTNVINAAGSRIDTFMLNGSGQGLTTINGFGPSDVLDLTRTLSGVDIAANLSNLTAYVGSSVANGSTTLYVDPTGGSGTHYAFAMLQGVTTSITALVASNEIKVG